MTVSTQSSSSARRKVSGEELAKVDAMRKELGTSFCRRCNYCAPCTVGIDIPNQFAALPICQAYFSGLYY